MDHGAHTRAYVIALDTTHGSALVKTRKGMRFLIRLHDECCALVFMGCLTIGLGLLCIMFT